MIWRHATGSFAFGNRPLVMGILNVTPDSFSDGGEYVETNLAVEHAFRLLDEGADLIDIGGESTRPGSQPVEAGEEMDRVLPVIEILKRERPSIVLSLDTTKAAVARAGIAAGVSIINDVSGGRWDQDLWHEVVKSDVGYVLMHAKARPDVMQSEAVYEDVVAEISHFLQIRSAEIQSGGVAEERLVYDVGVGFGKTVDHNLALLRAQSTWAELKRPMLWGVSRKSFLGKVVADRAVGNLAVHGWLRSSLSARQPQIWRVHDVAETMGLLAMWERLENCRET